MHGEPPGQLYFRQRKTRLRPLILVLDVSGSMAAYSRHLLQFAHCPPRGRRHLGRTSGHDLASLEKLAALLPALN